MQTQEMKSRDQVEEALTWDLTALFETKEAFEEAVVNLKEMVAQFETNYAG